MLFDYYYHGEALPYYAFCHNYGILDIDECLEQSPCDENAVCTNTPGSFTCVCNNGYQGDGITCAGQSLTVYHPYFSFCGYLYLLHDVVLLLLL